MPARLVGGAAALSRRIRIGLGVALALLVLGFSGRSVLWERSPVPETSDFRLDLARVRELAGGHGGRLPTALNSLRVSQFTFPEGAVIAGAGSTDLTLYHHSFQLVFPERTIVIGAVHDEKIQERWFRGQPWSRQKWDEMQQAMRRASLILASHEHFDHVGGIAASPFLDEILDRVMLTREQIEGFTMRFSGFPSGALERLVPLEYDTLHSPAPGVVLIKAPGHSTGHQFMFLKLATGTEFLYVGDSVWTQANVDRLTGRPLLTSMLMLADRSECANHIRLLYDGREGEAFPHVLVAHDGEQIDAYQRRGLIGDGFAGG